MSARGPLTLNLIITDIVAGNEDGLSDWPLTSSNQETSSKFFIRELTKFLVAENAIFTHQDKIGIIAAGTSSTDNILSQTQPGYEHLTCVAPLGDFDHQEILNLYDGLSSECAVGDLFSGIILATEYISSYSSILKNPPKEKRIYVITAQRGCGFDPGDDSDTVAEHLKSNGFEVYLMNCGTGRDEKGLAMKQWASRTGFHYMGASEINAYVSQPRKKRVALTTKSRSNLSFGGHFEIPVYIYLGVKEEVMPTAKSESIYGDEDSSNAVMSRAYYVKSVSADEAAQEVTPEERSKAYLYGKHLIPVGPAEQSLLNPPECEKCLDVIGTISQQKSDGLWLNRPTELIVPEPDNSESYVALMCLRRAMKEKGYSILARFVWRKNVPPKLVLISVAKDSDGLVLNYLPFAEDVKLELSLPVLPEPERSQQDCMNKLVTSMNLIKSVNDGDTEVVISVFEEDQKPYLQDNVFDEYFHPQTTWNPALQLFYHWSIFKLIRPAGSPMPPPPPQIAATFEVVDSILSDFNIVENLKKAFPLERVQDRREALSKQWQSAVQEKKTAPILNVNDILGDEKLADSHVSELQPIESFKAIVDINKPDLTNRAFAEFAEIVKDRAAEISQSPGVESIFLDLLKYHREQSHRLPGMEERHNTLLLCLTDIFRMDIDTYKPLVPKILNKTHGPLGEDLAGASTSLKSIGHESKLSLPTAPITTTAGDDLDELE